MSAMAADRPDPRDAILDRFEAGEITKEEADAEARAVGFCSMERRPDLAGLDCFELPRWTMPQLMTWAIDHSSEEVLALSEEYRLRTRIWQSEDLIDANGEKLGIAWRLRPPDKLSVYDVVAEALSREGSEGRAPRAIRLRAELGSQFLRGELTAYGKKRLDDEPSAIPNPVWDTIDLFDLPCNHFDPEDVGRENEETPRYFGVYVIPEKVISIWPRLGSESGETQTRAEKTKVPTKPEQLARVLRRFSSERPPQEVPSKEASDDDARHIIREAMAANDGFISQKGGAEIVRAEIPGFNKERAMKLVKGLTQNTKPGPRGPRQKLSGK